MTLAAANPLVTYIGNDSTGTFPFPFPVYIPSQITVTVAGPTQNYTLALGTDFSVSGLNNNGSPASTSGIITLINLSQAWIDASGNLAATYSITLERIVPLAQLTSIRNQGSFLPETLEDALDIIVMMIQQLQNTISGGSSTPAPPVINLPSIMQIVSVSTTPFNLVSGHTYLVHTASQQIVLLLPPPVANTWFIIKDADRNAWNNNIGIVRNGGETIDGVAATLQLVNSNGSWMIVSDGTNWYSVAMGADMVLSDIANGHTYRILMDNGIISKLQVT